MTGDKTSRQGQMVLREQESFCGKATQGGDRKRKQGIGFLRRDSQEGQLVSQAGELLCGLSHGAGSELS